MFRTIISIKTIENDDDPYVSYSQQLESTKNSSLRNSLRYFWESSYRIRHIKI